MPRRLYVHRAGRGPCDHARVPNEFLPPDPNADAGDAAATEEPAAQGWRPFSPPDGSGERPRFEPPSAGGGGAGQGGATGSYPAGTQAGFERPGAAAAQAAESDRYAGFAPPAAGGGAAAAGGGGSAGAKSGRATTALAVGAAGLGLLVFTLGALFVLTLPASIAGWVMGNKAKADPNGRDQANVAVIIGIVGTVLGVIAAVVWIAIAASDLDTTTEPDRGPGEPPPFDVVRAPTALQ